MGEKVAIIQDFCPMESTVMPAFLNFLAKRQRLQSLKKILKEYVQVIYFNQQITPVKCFSADPLTDDQKAAIITKMKTKLGAEDIKLICEADRNLLGGFRVEDGLDLSLRNFLEEAAVSEGVLVGDF